MAAPRCATRAPSVPAKRWFLRECRLLRRALARLVSLYQLGLTAYPYGMAVGGNSAQATPPTFGAPSDRPRVAGRSAGYPVSRGHAVPLRPTPRSSAGARQPLPSVRHNPPDRQSWRA